MLTRTYPGLTPWRLDEMPAAEVDEYLADLAMLAEKGT